MARLNHMFDNKYVITVNARRDGSSKLGTNHKWGFFPSASAAWIISNEEFMKSKKYFLHLNYVPVMELQVIKMLFHHSTLYKSYLQMEFHLTTISQ